MRALELVTVKDVAPVWFEFNKAKRPKVKKVNAKVICLEVTCLDSVQEHILIENKLEHAVGYTAAISATGKDPCSWKEYPLKKACAPFSFVPDPLEAESEWDLHWSRAF